MEIDIRARTYLTSGGSAIFSILGDQLMLGLGDYGTAVRTMEITVFHRSPNENPRRDLQEIFDIYHEYLNRLPKVTFRRKLKRIEIEFVSEHFDAHDGGSSRRSIEKSRVAALEVTEALSLLKKRIKPADDFERDRFFKDAAEVLSQQIRSLEEWEAISERADQKRLALHAAKSPWEQLEIDWSQFHPRAREILDDLFFWDCINDIAPHGNDVGADLLEDFREWNKRNSKKSPLVFLEELSEEMGIEPFDWSVTNQDDVLRLDNERPIEMGVGNESAIALAFAVLKMRASCPLEAVELAKCALERTSIIVKASSLNDENKAEWDAGIKRMKSKLESLPR